MITTLVDYFDTVGQFLQGVWNVLANAVEAAAFFPHLVDYASLLMQQGLNLLPSGSAAIISFAAVGVLAFRCLRM